MSREPRIDAYIAKAQPFARPILEKVRERVHAVVPDVEEAMKWSMPTYCSDGKIVLGHRRVQSTCGAQFLARAGARAIEAKAGAMGQFGKLDIVDDLPPDADLDALIREAAELARPRPRRARPSMSPSRRRSMHPDFAAALAKAPKAKAALEGFSPSAQRDYLEWIAEAKQDATRQKRIATAVEWLSEGKRRHWKYENC